MTPFDFGAGIEFSIANDADRECIYKMRYRVYTAELHQHPINPSEKLKDSLDEFNIYIVAKREERLLGFISVTPANAPQFSVDKYVSRSVIGFPFDDSMFEIRLLTVDKVARNSSLALLLMYAAMRWIEAHDGRNIIAICRSEILGMYLKAGMKQVGYTIKSGAVSYELCIATVENLKKFEIRKKRLFDALKKRIHWMLPFPFTAAACFHGGEFFKAIGEDLQTLDKHKQIINADVLDAWFPPSPKVVAALQGNLPWLLQTSPPTHADGLIEAIGAARSINPSCILPGAGSSNLIFLGLQYFLNKNSRVLILEPCYGEYIHVLENVIGCSVTRFKLLRHQDFEVDVHALADELNNDYDMFIIVNPNSPTGKYVCKDEMLQLLLNVKHTKVWIDETYIEYTGQGNSLEQFASATDNVIVCKSMSKVYALSGARCAYLCCSPMHVQALKHLTPPWFVSLPAQLAAIKALSDVEYYTEKYSKTHVLRKALIEGLYNIGIDEIIEGMANFVLFFLPANSLTAAQFSQECKLHNLFIRDVKAMGATLGNKAVRIAVKDANTNQQMLQIMAKVLTLRIDSSAVDA